MTSERRTRLSFTKTGLGVVLVVVLGVVLRGMGVPYGYPIPTHPDEPRLVDAALRMVVTGDLNPHFFNYPSLNIYLQAGLYRISMVVSEWFGITLIEQNVIWFYIIGRSFHVVMSGATLVVTYLLGKRLFSPLVGLLAAVFLASSFLHVSNSFLITVDTAVALWASLSILMAVRVFEGKAGLSTYLLGGLFVGLAVSSKYTAVLTALPLCVAHVVTCRDWRKLVDLPLISFGICVLLGFFLTTPYSLLDFETFFAAIVEEGKHYRSGHHGAESTLSTSYHLYLRNLLVTGYGILPSLAAAGGVWLLFKTEKTKAWFLLSFPLMMFLFMGSYKVFFPRNLVAILPCIAILSGVFTEKLYRWLTDREQKASGPEGAHTPLVLLVLFMILAVVGQIRSSLSHIRSITLPDSRWIGLHWILQNVPEGASIGREQYTPPLEKWTRNYSVNYFGVAGVVNRADQVPDLDYVVVSSYNYDRFIEDQERYPKESKVYTDLFANHLLIGEIVPDNIQMGGPDLLIFQIQSEAVPEIEP